MYNVGQIQTTPKGIQILAGLRSVFIKQKIELLEVITGCETENSYKVYPGDANGKKAGKVYIYYQLLKIHQSIFIAFIFKLGDDIFKVKEKSHCLARNCLPGNCRPFELKVKEEFGSSKSVALYAKRDYACTCFCLNRYCKLFQ